MRLWSLHPCHLDPKGLVALWREALLAQKVLLGETRGYRHHPQLQRFRMAPDPLVAIGDYLGVVADEAARRGYAFNQALIVRLGSAPPIDVTAGQVAHEWKHLLSKLQQRAPGDWARATDVKAPELHPLFRVVPGEVEDWER